MRSRYRAPCLRPAPTEVLLLPRVILRMLTNFMQRSAAMAILLAWTIADTANGYGPIGHEIVGEIADQRLANTPTGKKVRELVEGFSLQKAAVIADEIKSWDKKTPEDPKTFHYSRRPQIDA